MFNQQTAQTFTPGWNDPPINTPVSTSNNHRLLQQKRRPVDPSIQSFGSSPSVNNYSPYQQQTLQANPPQHYPSSASSPQLMNLQNQQQPFYSQPTQPIQIGQQPSAFQPVQPNSNNLHYNQTSLSGHRM